MKHDHYLIMSGVYREKNQQLFPLLSLRLIC